MSRNHKLWGGARWRAARAHWSAALPHPCSRCGELVYPWQPWDIDHPLGIATAPDVTAPAHRSCNRRAGMLVAQALRTVGMRSRQW